MKLRINKDKLIPNVGETFKIILSAMLTSYLVKPALITAFPALGVVDGLVALVVWVIIIVWLKDLFDLKWNGRDWF